MDQDLQVNNGKELAQIIRSLGKIEATLEHLLTIQNQQTKRIEWLESKANWAIGALATFTFLISAGFEFIKGLFR